MNVIPRICTAVLLLSVSVAAQSGKPAVTKARRRTTPAAAAQPATPPSNSAPTSLSGEIRQLREMVQAQQLMMQSQQQQIEQLRQEMARRDQQMQQTQATAQTAQQTAVEAQNRANAGQETAQSQQQTVASLQSSVATLQLNQQNAVATMQEDQKRVGGLEGTLKRFNWGGDLRVRYENFIQDSAVTRHRARFRARFGFEGKTDDFSGGLYLASGANDVGLANFFDPVSTNQTMTDFFERKTIGIDRSWITYNPSAAKWLSLTGGKFAPTWNKTTLTFDPDLNPEGFSEKVSVDVKNAFLKNFSVTAMQLLFREVAAGDDSSAIGISIAPKFQFGKRVTVTPTYTLIKWNNTDVIVQQAGKSLGGSVGTGKLFNALNAAKTGYLSGFLYSNLLLDTNVTTHWKRFPARLLLEYQDNLDAATSQGQAFFSEFSIGQTKDRKDVQIGYNFIRIEQDAVIAAFNESDLRAQTNVSQHRLFLNWQVQKNTTAGYTIWVGRFLNPTIAGLAAPDPTLKRMQFDVVYKF